MNIAVVKNHAFKTGEGRSKPLNPPYERVYIISCVCVCVFVRVRVCARAIV